MPHGVRPSMGPTDPLSLERLLNANPLATEAGDQGPLGFYSFEVVHGCRFPQCPGRALRNQRVRSIPFKASALCSSNALVGHWGNKGPLGFHPS